MKSQGLLFVTLITLLSGFFVRPASAAATRAADITEVHWLLCGSSTNEITSKLRGDDDSDVKSRDVYYYETEGRTLFASGIVLRVREKKHGLVTSTVKIRVANVDKIDQAWSSDQGFKCESDRHGLITNLNCSLSRDRAEDDEPFSSTQIQFLLEVGGVKLNSLPLLKLGPSEETAWKNLRLRVGRENIPVGLEKDTADSLAAPIFELSTRVAASAASQRWTEVNSALARVGLQLCADQSSKTSRLLEALAAR